MKNQNQTQKTRAYKCPVCEKEFKFNFVPSHVARVHMKIKNVRSDNQFYTCPYCDFKRKSGLLVYKHIYQQHFQHQVQQTQQLLPPSPSDEIIYEDWNNLLPILKQAYENSIFVLILGPKGTGKTTLVRKFAQEVGAKLFSINFSLRTKESNLVGATMLKNGSTEFALGIIPQSMQEGGILYLDELNASEPDVLLRLDEALDDRRELVLKEAGEAIHIRAHPKWFVVATVNPLSHAGTKELPPQLLSRFPVRLVLDYPPSDVEEKITKMYTSGDGKDLRKAIKLARKLREAAKVEDIYYSPSLRETIAFAKLIEAKVEPRQAAELVFANVYYQWGDSEIQKVKDLIVSLWGERQ